MCGRYTHALTWRDIVELYRLTAPAPPPGWSPRYNIAPSQEAPVIRVNAADGGRECAMLRWGLVPFWSKEAKPGYSTINARADTVASKSAFREAYKRRRCVVPASGFYEWREEAGSKGKQPYHFRHLLGGPMSFAGLWERWQKEDAPPHETFSIVVCAASPQMRPYHDRMPVILTGHGIDSWLDPLSDPKSLAPLLVPFTGPLEIDSVSKAVNNPRNDSPALLAG
jgi:putative SOS response-associated peptidase YedK